jgi:hypothetical protein
MTRSDAYLIEAADNARTKDLSYIDEGMLAKMKYRIIPGSGISIKRADSRNYQILKLTPASFNKLFGEYELGAGASIYCEKVADLEKNDEVLLGWRTTRERFMRRFNFDTAQYYDRDSLKLIKQKANTLISEMIDNDENLQKRIFNGIGLYDEPYTAHFIYSGDRIEPLRKMPYFVTTGSGRSHGDYTVVLKPK